MSEVEKRIEDENERVFQYFDQSTKRPLISTVERVCIAAHVDTIINKGKCRFVFATRFLKFKLTPRPTLTIYRN